MKFNIFSLSERYYRIVTGIITISVTIGCFIYYYNIKDKSNTFIMATLYAAFLFIIGLYISYKSNSISNKLYERKSSYITLVRLAELFSASCIISLSSYKDVNMAVISFQVFTGRTKKKVSKEKKKNEVLGTVPLDILAEDKPMIEYRQTEGNAHYINEMGFKFTTKLKNLEDGYTEYHLEVTSEFEKVINSYIKKNDIHLNVSEFNELDLLDINYEDWCDTHLKEESKDKKAGLVEVIYKTLDNMQAKFNILDDKKRKLISYYKKCNDQTQKNLKKMRSTYGNRLEFIINTKDDIMIEIDAISRRLDEIQQLIYDNNITEKINDSLYKCNRNINVLYDRMVDTEENLLAQMDISIVSLKEDIGMEIDSKDEFKTLIKQRKTSQQCKDTIHI